MTRLDRKYKFIFIDLSFKIPMNTKIQARCEYLTWTFVVGCSQLYMNQLSQGNLNATTSLYIETNLIRTMRLKSTSRKNNKLRTKKTRFFWFSFQTKEICST